MLGPDDAAVLMQHLPPTGWADVATKLDLQATKNELLATFRAELLAQTHTMVRTVVFTNAASVIAVAGIAFAAARLT